MSIAPAARGHGVAMALHEELRKFAKDKGLDGIALGTSSYQTGAIALYRKLGYKQTNVVHRTVPLGGPVVSFLSFELPLP